MLGSNCKSLRQLIERHQGQVILRNVDCGRELDFWFVPFSATELESWRLSQKTFFANPNGNLDSLYEIFGEIPPPHSQIEIPGRFLTAKNSAQWNLWRELARSTLHYVCELCCDTDSYLKRTDRVYLYHAGFEGVKRM